MFSSDVTGLISVRNRALDVDLLIIHSYTLVQLHCTALKTERFYSICAWLQKDSSQKALVHKLKCFDISLIK